MNANSLSLTLTSPALALANHVWQSTLVACIAGLLTLTLRRNHARARYALWLVASIKFLVPFSLLMVLGAHLASLRPATPRHHSAADSLITMEQINQPFTLAPAFDAAPSSTAPAAAPSVSDRIATLWNRGPQFPIALAAAWLIGFLAVSVRWTMRSRRISTAIQLSAPLQEGREFEILQRMRRLAGLRGNIELRPLPASMEPGIFGIFRPVLLWPQAITQRLEDTHLEAVLAHEVCHVRRRDNLTAALHMLVEALFWFHPLVWWLEKRLVEERENACDEEVLELCGHSRIYAESILKVCEFCVETPLACVSGVTGADLKRRIAQILANRTALKLTLTKKLLLATTSLLVVAVPIVLGQASGAQRMMLAAIHVAPRPVKLAAHPMIAAEQTPSTGEIAPPNAQPTPATSGDVERAEFEVATIRPSNPNDQNYGFQADGHQIFYENERVVDLIAYAYGLRASQVARAPEWVDKERYDIRGIANQPNEPTTKQQQHMLRKLLEERFQLKSHSETREMPVYVVTVAKGGPKLTKSPSDDYAMGDENTQRRGTQMALQFKHATLADFALNLAYYVDRPVVDQTNIQGRYDFDLRYTSDEAQSTDPNAPPGLFTAVQEQLGIKLDAVKAPADVVVIDGIEKPSVDGAEVAPAVSAVPVAQDVTSARANRTANIAATWQGTLQTGRNPRFVVKITKAGDGTLGATFYLIDQGGGGVPAISVTLNGSLLKLELPFGVYEGTLSADGNSITGTWKQGPNPVSLSFARATPETEWTIPPAPPRLPAMATNADPTFEVATIKPSRPDEHGPLFGIQGRHFSVIHTSLGDLVNFAYGLQLRQIAGAPDWFTSERYDISGVPGGEGAPSTKQWKSMVGKLLADRFQLKFHYEKREQNVYALTVAKTGPKLKRSQSDPSAQMGVGFGPAGNFGATNATMADVADALGHGAVDRPVVDQTGLTGKFDLRLTWTPDGPPTTTDNADAPPDLFTAIQQELGLKLESTKAPVDVLVIDRIEKPSEN